MSTGGSDIGVMVALIMLGMQVQCAGGEIASGVRSSIELRAVAAAIESLARAVDRLDRSCK